MRADVCAGPRGVPDVAPQIPLVLVRSALARVRGPMSAPPRAQADGTRWTMPEATAPPHRHPHPQTPSQRRRIRVVGPEGPRGLRGRCPRSRNVLSVASSVTTHWAACAAFAGARFFFFWSSSGL